MASTAGSDINTAFMEAAAAEADEAANAGMERFSSHSVPQTPVEDADTPPTQISGTPSQHSSNGGSNNNNDLPVYNPVDDSFASWPSENGNATAPMQEDDAEASNHSNKNAITSLSG